MESDRGSAKLTMFVLLLRPWPVDASTTAGKRIEFLWSVLTDLLFLLSRVGSDPNDTCSRAKFACCTVFRRAS